MPVKEIILICYMLCIILGVSDLTISVLAGKRSNTELNRSLALFIAGMLIVCFYDMAIYYCDYVIGVLSSLKVQRIGNCIIAGTMYFWIGFQARIIGRQALSFMDVLARRYALFYMAMWLLLTLFLPMEHFYTMKWLLLVTDIILLVVFLASSVAHIVFAATTDNRLSLYYMIVVTAIIMWKYLSYFRGETSVYRGDSYFIVVPVELNIIFWVIINVLTLIYAYRSAFLSAFEDKGGDDAGKKDTIERIDEVCDQYKLTPREKEFIELIYMGKSNREIAETLFLSESTVKTHVYNIFRKMDVKNRIGVICVINGDIEDAEE